MQIDDTLILAAQSFAVAENEAINSAKIMIKKREQLTSENSLNLTTQGLSKSGRTELSTSGKRRIFKTYKLIQSVETIITISAQSKMRIKLISKEQYVTQRARGTYLTSICQSKASFDLSHVVQFTEMSEDNVNVLNKRLQ
jgi:hypothetical protein